MYAEKNKTFSEMKREKVFWIIADQNLSNVKENNFMFCLLEFGILVKLYFWK